MSDHEEGGSRLFTEGTQLLQLIGRQRQNAVQRLHEGNVRCFLATGVKKVAKSAMICLHAALVCQEHVAHEDDSGMSDQGIEIKVSGNAILNGSTRPPVANRRPAATSRYVSENRFFPQPFLNCNSQAVAIDFSKTGPSITHWEKPIPSAGKTPSSTKLLKPCAPLRLQEKSLMWTEHGNALSSQIGEQSHCEIKA
jgi:hypothetical protein